MGSAINAAIAVKDYETLGIIFVKSSEVIDGNGNHTGSKITYEMLMKEAQELGADDVINIRIDVNQKEDFSIGGMPICITYNYTATALAIKYTTVVEGVGVVYSIMTLTAIPIIVIIRVIIIMAGMN